jgi:WD40 repeat protein
VTNPDQYDGNSGPLYQLDQLMASLTDDELADVNDICYQLVEGQLWWHACTDAVTRAPERLRAWADEGDLAVALLLDIRGEATAATAQMIAGVAFALACGARGPLDETVEAMLRRAIAHWTQANVLPTATTRSSLQLPVPPDAHPGLDTILTAIDSMKGGPARTLVALQAAELAGALSPHRHRRDTQVLFEEDRHSSTGVWGTLASAVVPDGPPGLYPDPAAMAYLRADPEFAESMTQAWRHATRGKPDPPCVMWTLTAQGQEHQQVTGRSLGAAFAVTLVSTLEAQSRRLRPATLFRTRRTRCAITGTVNADGTVGPVGGLPSKLAAAQARKLHVIAPAANTQDSQQAVPPGVSVSWVSTVAEARKATRKWRPARLVTAGILAVLLAGLGSFYLFVDERQQRQAEAEERNRQDVADELLLQADLARGQEPQHALRLASAAMQISPSDAAQANLVRTLFAKHRLGAVRLEDEVIDVAISSDAKLLLTLERKVPPTEPPEPAASLWDIDEPRNPQRAARLDTTEVGGGGITSVALAANGHTALTGLDNGTLVIWDVTSPDRPHPSATLQWGTRPISRAQFAPKQQRIVLANDCGEVSVWDTSRTPPILGATVTIPSWSCQSRDGLPHSPPVALDATGTILLTASGDSRGTALLWDTTSLGHASPIASLPGIVGQLSAIAIGPDGKTAATASDDRMVSFWDISDRSQPSRVGVFQPATEPQNAIAFGPDGQTLITGGEGGVPQLWDVRDLTRPVLIDALGGHASGVEAARISANGTTAVTASRDKTAVLWDITDPAPANRASATGTEVGTVTTTTISATTDVALITSEEETVTTWDIADTDNPQKVGTLSNHGGVPPAISADGRFALVPGPRDTTVMWDLTDIAQPRSLATLGSGSVLAISADGRKALTGYPDGAAQLWHIAPTGVPDPPVALPGFAGPAEVNPPVVSVAFDTTGRLAVVAREDGSVALWEVGRPAQPRLESTFATTAPTLVDLALSPNGRIAFAIGPGDLVGELWDVTDPRRPTRFGALGTHTGSIQKGSFSASAEVLLTVTSNSTVLLWHLTDPTRPQELATLRHDQGGTTQTAAISADLRTVVLTTSNGDLVFWDITQISEILTDPLTRACAVAGGLAPDEWASMVRDLPYQKTCRP